jgi:hypothetical protein
MKFEDRKQKALDSMLDGKLTVEEKNTVRQRADKEIGLAQTEVERLRNRAGTSEDAIDYTLSFMGNAPRMWNDASPSMKTKLQSMIFPEGVYYDLRKNIFGTTKVSPLYTLASIKKDPTKADESLLVTPAGFEPAIFWMRTSSESRRRLP